MKNITTSAIIVFISSLFFFNSVLAQPVQKNKANKQTREWRYEVMCMGVGVEGTKLIKVWSYSKNATVAKEQSKKNAIHAMIFQGFAGNGAKGCPTQKALASPGLEDEKDEFFNSFFADGGKYMKYATVSNDGAPGAGDIVKVGKEYKIGVVVSVMYDELRKYLEDAGIVKGLNSGF